MILQQLHLCFESLIHSSLESFLCCNCPKLKKHFAEKKSTKKLSYIKSRAKMESYAKKLSHKWRKILCDFLREQQFPCVTFSACKVCISLSFSIVRVNISSLVHKKIFKTLPANISSTFQRVEHQETRFKLPV